jgi:peptide/nickel transport system substrate-binding protein
MHAGATRVLAAVVTALLLCSCTKAGQSDSGPDTHSLSMSNGSGDPSSLNAHLYTEITVGYISQLTGAYLVKYGPDNRPEPELVTEVPTQQNGDISKDGTAITFHLRKGVRWSDGAPFNADDVVWSTNAVNNPANNEVGRDGWNLIKKIDEPDKYTVVYHLSKPYAAYEPTFFGSAGANPTVLPKHLLGNLPNFNNVPFNAKPVGIGPYRVVVWHRGDSIELEANPYYFRGLPKIRHISYKLVPSRDTLLTLMQTGDVGLWPEVPPSYISKVQALPDDKTLIRPGPWFSHLTINVSRPLVSDVRVRRAIRFAIDRPTLMKKIVQGHGVVQESVVPTVNPIAPTIPMVNYDPAKAKALLDEAGWKVGPGGIRVKNGVKMSLQLAYYTGASTADETVELIREELRAVGIDLQTRKFATSVFFAPYQDNGIVYTGKWDLTMFAWQADPVGDISVFVGCDVIPPAGQNISRFCDPQLQRLLDTFKVTYDENTHRRLLAQEVKIVDEQVPMIVLYVLDNGYAFKPSLTNFNPGAWTAFDNFMNTDI